MFAYPDAARYRLGVNYQQLPTNSARAPVYCPFQRDGLMNFSSNYGDDPDYIGSSLRPTTFATSSKGNYVSSTITEHERWIGEVCSFTSTVTDQDFEQPAALWKVLRREPGQQDRFVGNVADSVQKVTSAKLRASVYDLFARVDPQLGAWIKENAEANIH
ncbi:hypothetical protein MPDQ_006988 [Monascus purpureus]|uniref:Catalase core domain-containing protein n=1 Tax=Monascus purpureus TaxID=5098 RepID=A0A507QX42_MONPU|nr:hypothetical protein MPDQ_006988 [Monascus purpureus]